MNPVSILWLRQLKRYFRSRARMIGSLGEPTLFLLTLGFGLGLTFAHADRGDYVQFLAPGIVTMGILFTAVFSGIEIIWDRQFGFLTRRAAQPAQPRRRRPAQRARRRFRLRTATDFAVVGLIAAILLAIGAWIFSKIEA